jgi:hypothetical protein
MALYTIWVFDHQPVFGDGHVFPTPNSWQQCVKKRYTLLTGVFLVHCIPNGRSLSPGHWECNEPKGFLGDKKTLGEHIEPKRLNLLN